MAEPEDMIIPMLKQMREETRGGFNEVQSELKGVNERLDRLDEGQKNLRNAMTADTMMSKFLLGDYEERLAALEEQVAKLSKRQ